MKYKVRIASRHPSHKAILKIGQMPMFNVRVRVRFGSTKKHRKCSIDFNSIGAINNTANKMRMKVLFREAGINSPKYFENTIEGRGYIESGMLGERIFFKTPFHSRGRGMVVYESKEDAINQGNRGYFEQAQVSDREFRVHVMDGEMFCIDEKRPRDTSMRRSERPEIKNMDSGFKFRQPREEYPSEVITESIKAVEVLGLDFGAADVGLNADGVWIYEVNSAPSLRTKTRKLYQKALVKAINRRILGDDATDKIEALSISYNTWLDEQPLTD